MIRSVLIGSLILFSFLLAPAAFYAQGAVTAPERLPLSERVWIATQIYSSIETYFGHWRGVPGLDLDKEFQNYLDKVLANDDRRAFDLASMELLAKLKNGHSGFGDPWLRLNDGQRLGFYAYPIDGQWVVTQSSNPGLKAGDVIARIDEESFESFFESRRKYVSASDERWVKRAFFEYPYLFPKAFTLELADGRKVSIVREGEFRWPGSEHTDITVREEDGVAYIRIPSFSDPKFENAAVKAVENLSKTKAVILDVRANHGGSSPVKLLKALMDRPYRWWSESTPVSIGVFKYRGALGDHAEVYWSDEVQKPSAKGYREPLYILVDGGCVSACEDFVVPFKDNHRATIIGERTAGSSGQPFGKDFDNGMGFALSTKREFFPDGSEFEGVGIGPDIEVHTRASDLKAGKDPVLEKAHELISALEQGAPSPANAMAPTPPVLHFTSQLTSQELSVSPPSASKQYLERLRREYKLDEQVVGLGSDFERVQAIAKWVRSRWDHNGSNEPLKADPLSILAEAKQGKQFRCVEYSIVLSAALNALHIPARVTGLMTAEVENAESGAGHVVTEAFLRDQRKWILVDGQWDVIPALDGVPVNAVELQSALANRSAGLTVYSLMKTDAGQYFAWIAPYLYYFDTKIKSRPEDSYSRHSEALILVSLGSKEPRVFQRRMPLERVSYTHSLADFYPSAN